MLKIYSKALVIVLMRVGVVSCEVVDFMTCDEENTLPLISCQSSVSTVSPSLSLLCSNSAPENCHYHSHFHMILPHRFNSQKWADSWSSWSKQPVLEIIVIQLLLFFKDVGVRGKKMDCFGSEKHLHGNGCHSLIHSGLVCDPSP